MFTIDGITWDIPCTITRTAEIKASDISGLMLDKSYFNDVIGTYMSYTIKLAVPNGKVTQYAEIYEALTNPVDGHTFVLPYNDDTLNLTARVANVSDVYVRLPGGGMTWRGISFTAIGINPTKVNTLDTVLSMGRAPVPVIAMPEIGDTYTYTSNGWVKVGS